MCRNQLLDGEEMWHCWLDETTEKVPNGPTYKFYSKYC